MHIEERFGGLAGLAGAPTRRAELLYAIGDIHGRIDLLDELLEMVEADAEAQGATATIVFTGDYVDRGPDSFRVIERVMAGPKRHGDRFVCLQGNHDQLFVQQVLTGETNRNWYRHLFTHTILSYGADETNWKANANLRRHAKFLGRLPYHYVASPYLFVHAGVRPGIELEGQSTEDLLWIRKEFLEHAYPLPWTVVHGHTIIGTEAVRTLNRVSIDTGAYYTGILTAAAISSEGERFIYTDGPADVEARRSDMQLRERVEGKPMPSALMEAYADCIAGRLERSALLRIEDELLKDY